MRQNHHPLCRLLCLALTALLFLSACGAADQPETTTQPPEPAQTEFVWPSGSLRADPVPFTDGNRSEWADTAAEYPVFGSELLRGQISSVTFLGTLSDAAETAWDVSAAGDGSVLAWTVPNGDLHDLFIGGEGGVSSTDSCKMMFTGYVNTGRISFGGNFHTAAAADLEHMFLGCRKLTEIDLNTLDTTAAIDLHGLFYECASLEELDLTGVILPLAEDLSSMFFKCENLRALDLSGFQSESAVNLSQLFRGCAKLHQLDLSGLITDHAENLSSMFCGCGSLTELDLANFHTSSVRDMSKMFYSCMELRDLQLGSFDTSSVTDMSDMFNCCYNLKELDVSGFDTSSVTNMSGMFRECVGLNRLDLSGFDTSKVEDASWMLFKCSGIQKLRELEHLDFSSVTSYENFIYNNPKDPDAIHNWESLFNRYP